jgi:hypothetical protein
VTLRNLLSSFRSLYSEKYRHTLAPSLSYHALPRGTMLHLAHACNRGNQSCGQRIRTRSLCKFQRKREREISLKRPFSSHGSAKYFNVTAKKVQIFNGSANKSRSAGGKVEVPSAKAPVSQRREKPPLRKPVNKPERLLQLVRASVEGFLSS